MIDISLLEMSVKGAFLIILIVVIRSLLINYLPKKTFIALWVVALYSLLIPISVPSKFSVYSFIQNNIYDFGKYENNNINLFDTSNNIAQEVSEVERYVSPMFVFWVIGFILTLGFFVTLYFRFQWKIKTSIPIKNEYIGNWLSKHTLRRSIEIRQSAEISSPLTYGIFKPIIIMPQSTDWSDINSLQYIITHEFIHIKRFDLLTKIFLTLALCTHWFNPLVWVMYILANRDIELVCDECVLQELSVNAKSFYANILINMEEKKIGLTPFCNNFSKNAVEERIIAIMKTKKKTLFTSIIAAAIVIGSATAFATTSAYAKEPVFAKTEETNSVYNLTNEETGLFLRGFNNLFNNRNQVNDDYGYDDYRCENHYRENGSRRYGRGRYGHCENRYSRNSNSSNYRYNRGCHR